MLIFWKNIPITHCSLLITTLPSQKNINQVKNLTDKINQAKSFILVDYRGLTVKQVTTLRQKVKEADGELKVTKNTLLKLALKNTLGNKEQLDNFAKALTGPTMALFSFEDPAAPLKVLGEFAKEVELPKVKVGLLGTAFLPTNKVQELTKLPSRDELRAQTISQLSAPIYGFVNVLSGNIRKLVYVLNSIKQIKN